MSAVSISFMVFGLVLEFGLLGYCLYVQISKSRKKGQD